LPELLPGYSCDTVLIERRQLHVITALMQVNAGIAKLTVGRPEDDAAIVPVVSESSAKFVEGLVMDAKEKGATLCQEYKREVNSEFVRVDDFLDPNAPSDDSKQPAALNVMWLLCRATSSGRCCWTT
jgi:acyl-CoA reductase-like NAD-dependent aldehyde dehydrogenase